MTVLVASKHRNRKEGHIQRVGSSFNLAGMGCEERILLGDDEMCERADRVTKISTSRNTDLSACLEIRPLEAPES